MLIEILSDILSGVVKGCTRDLLSFALRMRFGRTGGAVLGSIPLGYILSADFYMISYQGVLKIPFFPGGRLNSFVGRTDLGGRLAR